MLKLFQYQNHWGFNSSPFCLKIESTLKALNIPFFSETETLKVKIPKGKLPVIENDETGEVIPDSEFILEYLEQKLGKSLNKNLSDYQKSISYAFKKMLEEHFYWILLHSRWFDIKNAATTKDEYFGTLPTHVIEEIYIKTRRDFSGCGLGLHAEEEIYALGIKDLKSISDFLKNRNGKYAFGDEISELDTIIYSFVGQVIWAEKISSPLKDYIENEKEKTILDYINFVKILLK